MQVCSGLSFDLWFWFVVVGFCSDGGEVVIMVSASKFVGCIRVLFLCLR